MFGSATILSENCLELLWQTIILNHIFPCPLLLHKTQSSQKSASF